MEEQAPALRIQQFERGVDDLPQQGHEAQLTVQLGDGPQQAQLRRVLGLERCEHAAQPPGRDRRARQEVCSSRVPLRELAQLGGRVGVVAAHEGRHVLATAAEAPLLEGRAHPVVDLALPQLPGTPGHLQQQAAVGAQLRVLRGPEVAVVETRDEGPVGLPRNSCDSNGHRLAIGRSAVLDGQVEQGPLPGRGLGEAVEDTHGQGEDVQVEVLAGDVQVQLPGPAPLHVGQFRARDRLADPQVRLLDVLAHHAPVLALAQAVEPLLFAPGAVPHEDVGHGHGKEALLHEDLAHVLLLVGDVPEHGDLGARRLLLCEDGLHQGEQRLAAQGPLRQVHVRPLREHGAGRHHRGGEEIGVLVPPCLDGPAHIRVHDEVVLAQAPGHRCLGEDLSRCAPHGDVAERPGLLGPGCRAREGLLEHRQGRDRDAARVLEPLVPARRIDLLDAIGDAHAEAG